MSKESNNKSKGAKIAATVSTVLWIVGFALAFVVPAQSTYGWVPDAMLLVGFFPLLYAWKPGWPWVVFGVLNMVIGFFLLLCQFLPDTNFTADMITVRKHLAEQHSPYTWMIIGIMSIIFGGVRMTIHLGQFAHRQIKRRTQVADATTAATPDSPSDPS